MIQRGDTVKANFFKQRFNRKTNSYERDFVAAMRGTVELVDKDEALVRFVGRPKLERIKLRNLEKVT